METNNTLTIPSTQGTYHKMIRLTKRARRNEPLPTAASRAATAGEKAPPDCVCKRVRNRDPPIKATRCKCGGTDLTEPRDGCSCWPWRGHWPRDSNHDWGTICSYCGDIWPTNCVGCAWGWPDVAAPWCKLCKLQRKRTSEAGTAIPHHNRPWERPTRPLNMWGKLGSRRWDLKEDPPTGAWTLGNFMESKVGEQGDPRTAEGNAHTKSRLNEIPSTAAGLIITYLQPKEAIQLANRYQPFREALTKELFLTTACPCYEPITANQCWIHTNNPRNLFSYLPPLIQINSKEDEETKREFEGQIKALRAYIRERNPVEPTDHDGKRHYGGTEDMDRKHNLPIGIHSAMLKGNTTELALMFPASTVEGGVHTVTTHDTGRRLHVNNIGILLLRLAGADITIHSIRVRGDLEMELADALLELLTRQEGAACQICVEGYQETRPLDPQFPPKHETELNSPVTRRAIPPPTPLEVLFHAHFTRAAIRGIETQEAYLRRRVWEPRGPDVRRGRDMRHWRILAPYLPEEIHDTMNIEYGWMNEEEFWLNTRIHKASAKAWTRWRGDIDRPFTYWRIKHTNEIRSLRMGKWQHMELARDMGLTRNPMTVEHGTKTKTTFFVSADGYSRGWGVNEDRLPEQDHLSWFYQDRLPEGGNFHEGLGIGWEMKPHEITMRYRSKKLALCRQWELTRIDRDWEWFDANSSPGWDDLKFPKMDPKKLEKEANWEDENQHDESDSEMSYQSEADGNSDTEDTEEYQNSESNTSASLGSDTEEYQSTRSDTPDNPSQGTKAGPLDTTEPQQEEEGDTADAVDDPWYFVADAAGVTSDYFFAISKPENEDDRE